MWTLWQQFKEYFPWTLLPYVWQPTLLELENRYRAILSEKDARYERMCENYRRDLRNQRAEHEAARAQDQRALILSDLLESLDIELDSEISEAAVYSDGGGERSRVCNVTFRSTGEERHYHVVAVDVTPINQKQEPAT